MRVTNKPTKPLPSNSEWRDHCFCGSAPHGLAVDAKGDIWVADTGNDRIQELNSKGEYIRKFGSEGTGNGQFRSPAAIAIDSEGDVWVADAGNDRMQRFTPEGTYLSQFGTAGNDDGQFSEPQGIAIDAKGNFWIADTGNDRVQEWLLTVPPTTYEYDQAGNLTAVERQAGKALGIDESYAY
ncbi:MAG: hypothetical protein WAN65_12910, partial [Candidatus Sulfotelmatobacter sp.]